MLLVKSYVQAVPRVYAACLLKHDSWLYSNPSHLFVVKIVPFSVSIFKRLMAGEYSPMESGVCESFLAVLGFKHLFVPERNFDRCPFERRF